MRSIRFERARIYPCRKNTNQNSWALAPEGNNFGVDGATFTITSDNLDAMNWRRGLLMAGINLAVALPMILMVEARDQEAALTSEEIMVRPASEAPPRPPEPPTPKTAEANAEPAEESVTFDLCTMWVHYPTRVVVIQGADLPSLALSGWETACPAPWSLASKLRGKSSWPPTPLWMEKQRQIDAGFCLLIAVQWIIVGGFPLVRSGKWWADPGAFITAFSVLAGVIALVPGIYEIARLPALIAMLSWFWWLGLLIWKTLKFGWRKTTAWHARRAN